MGCLIDLYELNYIDPETDVWNHVFNNEMVYDDKLFFITGDISAKNPELSAFVLQATSEASTNTTRTAYYDVALTYQQLRDEESREMLDLIFDNFTLDSCDLYQWGGMIDSVRKVFARVSSGNLSSILASGKKALEVTISLTTKQYDKNT